MQENIYFKEDDRKIGYLTFDVQDKKVNTLSPEIIEELQDKLKQIKGKNLKTLIINSNKKDSFIAGADLHVFRQIFQDIPLGEKLLKRGHEVLNTLQDLPFPTVAVIHGTCLGGGTELALACDFRIATDHAKTLIGLPETTLGIFPGWGGTQRLPKLIGLEESLNMILTGKPVAARKALKIHLIDSLFAAPFTEEGIDHFLKTIETKEMREKVLSNRNTKNVRTLLLEKNPLGRLLVFHLAKKNVLSKTKGHYPAPLIALDLIKRTYTLDLKEGLQEELNTFMRGLDGSFAIAKHLIELFFVNEELKKQSTLYAKEIKQIAVLGAGTMGAGIAFWLSQSGYSVLLKDVNNSALSKGLHAINAMYEESVKYKKLSKEQAAILIENITPTTKIPPFKSLDMVIEAASENPEIKRKIFEEIEKQVASTTILASNTSSISINAQAKYLKHPERFLGIHFFNPVNRMPLVEIIQGEHTSEEALDTAKKMCLLHKKIPIIVKDSAGFVVNRIFAPGLLEILTMLEEGIPMQDISKTLLDFGLPMDPFALADKVGNDINLHAMQTIEKAYGARMKNPKLLQLMVDHNLLGEKTKKGYFLHEGKQLKENPQIKSFIQPERIADKKEILDRPILSMINEASRCLEEKIIASPQELDMALIYGIGFPPFTGGLLRYADERGIQHIYERLLALEKAHGARFTPSNMLKKLFSEKKLFY
jgi:3-hydroxyacyl-CoA dehydrogenase / enoyl-CoA hydratase / 3-hydroxybutyryl-CoA epimerase